MTSSLKKEAGLASPEGVLNIIDNGQWASRDTRAEWVNYMIRNAHNYVQGPGRFNVPVHLRDFEKYDVPENFDNYRKLRLIAPKKIPQKHVNDIKNAKECPEKPSCTLQKDYIQLSPDLMSVSNVDQNLVEMYKQQPFWQEALFWSGHDWQHLPVIKSKGILARVTEAFFGGGEQKESPPASPPTSSKTCDHEPIPIKLGVVKPDTVPEAEAQANNELHIFGYDIESCMYFLYILLWQKIKQRDVRLFDIYDQTDCFFFLTSCMKCCPGHSQMQVCVVMDRTDDGDKCFVNMIQTMRGMQLKNWKLVFVHKQFIPKYVPRLINVSLPSSDQNELKYYHITQKSDEYIAGDVETFQVLMDELEDRLTQQAYFNIQGYSVSDIQTWKSYVYNADTLQECQNMFEQATKIKNKMSNTAKSVIALASMLVVLYLASDLLVEHVYPMVETAETVNTNMAKVIQEIAKQNTKLDEAGVIRKIPALETTRFPTAALKLKGVKIFYARKIIDETCSGSKHADIISKIKCPTS